LEKIVGLEIAIPVSDREGDFIKDVYSGYTHVYHRCLSAPKEAVQGD
jgi:hypothetical protein